MFENLVNYEICKTLHSADHLFKSKVLIVYYNSEEWQQLPYITNMEVADMETKRIPVAHFYKCGNRRKSVFVIRFVRIHC